MRRALVAVALLALAGIGLFAPPDTGDSGVLESAAGLRPGVADAAGSNRAGVVIDNGSSVRRVCIHFNGTLTGVEALQRAAQATVAPFGGLGAAVCAIDGVGCPGDNSCLTCQQPKFWSYSRAPSGSGGFSVSAGGASSSTVRDGDVEGWRWGGGTPSYSSAAQICGEVAPPPPVAPSAPPVSKGGGGNGAGGGGTGGSGGSGAGSASDPGGGGTDASGAAGGPAGDTPAEVAGDQKTSEDESDDSAATSSTAPTTDDTGDNADDGRSDDESESALGDPSGDSPGSSGTSVVGFVVLGLVLAGAATAFVVLRMRSGS